MTEPLLQVKNLSTHFFTQHGVVRAVDSISFEIGRGETLGLVGESGSGKSVTSLSLMRLVPDPPGRVVGGEVLFEGQNVLALPEKELRKLRGNRLAMVFQDPMTALNPYLTVGLQLSEVLETHRGLSRKEAMQKAEVMLKRVGIAEAATRLRQYPHEFSGGMRQRVLIAMALLCEPALLIADEPTTALDVTIQAQILALLQDLRRELGTSILLITHDLGVVAGLCDRVAVMYGGRIVEQGDTASVFGAPKHPYTKGLLASVPRLDTPTQETLQAIPGMPPDLSALPSGCAFHPRCPRKQDRCVREVPPWEGHHRQGVACFYPEAP